MITSAAEMLKALRTDKWCGVILYEGASRLDGAPVVAIANKITKASKNGKTGVMVQSFIIRSDVDPLDAVRTGADVSICGDCQHRPRPDPKTGKRKRTCYVNIGRSVRAVFEAYGRGRYARPGIDFAAHIIPDVFAGLTFRSGSYGDPTAAPFQVWRAATLKAKAKAGYTHQWRDPRFAAFKQICMASVDSAAEADEAEAAGWRCFRVRRKGEPLRKREAICPASAEAGHKTSCDACQACGGTEAKAKVSMVIMAHGIGAGAFEARTGI